MKSRFIHPLFPGGLNKAFTFSYADGVTQDERLIALFDRFGVKGTFNINSGLYGVGGIDSGDMRDMLTAAEGGNERAALAIRPVPRRCASFAVISSFWTF